MHRHLLQIGDWNVCPSDCTLTSQNGETKSKITPKSMDVLIYLARNAGSVVSASELLDEFWQGTASSDHAIHKVIAELRHALQDKAHNPSYIKTIPKRGYSLVANITEFTPDSTIKQVQPVSARGLSPGYLPRLIGGICVVAVIGIFIVWTEIDLAFNKSNDIRLAVLPFSQTGDDGSHRFFVDGLSDSLITGLSKLNELSVLSPGSNSAVSMSNNTPQSIGQMLKADHLLDGSVQYNGDKARVTVQLINASDGVLQYSEQFDLDKEGIFAVQDQIVSNVVTALSVHLDAHQRIQMRDWGTTNALAYEKFLKGDFYNNQFNPADFQLAIANYQAAIALDPNFINAYLGVVTAANNYAVFSGIDKIAELSDLVSEMLRRVSLIDPDSEVLESIRAIVLRMNGNDYRIQEASLRAEILSGTAPDFALAHYALFLIGARLYDEAQQLLDAAAEVDPFEISPDETWDYRVMVALPEDAIALRKQQLQERPNHTSMLGTVARNLVLTGEPDEARKFIARQIDNDSEGISSNFTHIVIGSITGEFAHNPAELKAQYALGPDFNFNNGALAFMLGDVETGIKFWQKLVPVQQRRLINMVHVSEVFFPDDIVTNPDYQDLLEELDFGISWQRTLIEGVMAMEPLTGVKLSDAARRAYAANKPMYRNNLWTNAQWASLANMMKHAQVAEAGTPII